jgi:hypothetical protein
MLRKAYAHMDKTTAMPQGARQEACAREGLSSPVRPEHPGLEPGDDSSKWDGMAASTRVFIMALMGLEQYLQFPPSPQSRQGRLVLSFS